MRVCDWNSCLDWSLRQRRMKRIHHTQDWTTNTELYLISTKEGDRRRNALTVDQRPVEAFQISNGKLFALFADLGVAA